MVEKRRIFHFFHFFSFLFPIRLLLSVHVHAVKFAEVKDQMLIFSGRYLDRCIKK